MQSEDSQQPDVMESDSPIKCSSSSATTPLNSRSLETAIAHPLRQQSSPAALNSLPQSDNRFRQCIMDLFNSAAVKRRKHIGRRLGISDPDIDRIEEENKNDSDEVFYRIMQKWYEKEGKAAVPQKLIDALIQENLNNVAETVTSKVKGLLEW